MKSKQTLKVGQKYKVINQDSSHDDNHIGSIIIVKRLRDLSNGTSFFDETGEMWDKHDKLQLLPKKEVKKWKYSRRDICIVLATLDVSKGRLKTVYDMILAKQSKQEDKKEDPKEKTPRDCIVCGKTIYEDYDSCINVCNQCANNKTKLVESKEIKEIECEHKGIITDILNGDFFCPNCNEWIKKQPSPSLLNDIETIEEPKNIKYLNSDLKRWVKQITKNQRILIEVIKSLLIK